MRPALLLVAALCVTAPALAQQAAPVPAIPDPADAPARAMLVRLQARVADVKAVAARFVQTRTSPLLDAPLVASGRLCYRRTPETLMLRIAEPRETVLRLDRKTYQVWRPADRQLEVFDLDGSGAARMFLLAFRPDVAEIEKAFRIRLGKPPPAPAVPTDPPPAAGAPADQPRLPSVATVRIELEPLDPALRKRLARVVLVVTDEPKPVVREVTTLDPEDETVAFALEALEIDPELPPDAFDLRIPADARVLRHAAEPAGGR